MAKGERALLDLDHSLGGLISAAARAGSAMRAHKMSKDDRGRELSLRAAREHMSTAREKLLACTIHCQLLLDNSKPAEPAQKPAEPAQALSQGCLFGFDLGA